jgi:hypothetical protein
MNLPSLISCIGIGSPFAAATFVVWATESAAEGKTVLESLAGPSLVCAWLGAIWFSIDGCSGWPDRPASDVE